MLSFLKYLLFSNEISKANQINKLKEELEYFEENDFDEEQNPNNKSIKANNNINIWEQTNIENLNEEGKCFQRVGIVTSFCGNRVVLDNSIFFNIDSILNVLGDISLGCKINYWAYKNPDTGHIKVVKIQLIDEADWNIKNSINQQINQQIDCTVNEHFENYTTHKQKFLGLITERKNDSILIDIDYEIINVLLDSVDITFIPKAGDRVYVTCIVQTDNNILNKQGEILEAVSVHPVRLLKNEECFVKKIYEESGELSLDAYFTNDILTNGYRPKEGDAVKADLIECETNGYKFRCIKLSLVEESKYSLISDKENIPKEIHAINVSQNITCILNSAPAVEILEVVCQNMLNKSFQCSEIQFLGRRRDCVVSLINIKPDQGFILNQREKFVIKFKVEAITCGQFTQQFVLNFNAFRIKRTINVIVCETEALAEALRQNAQKESESIQNINKNSFRVGETRQARLYTYESMSRNVQVIPGSHATPKCRFVANRLGQYDIPEKLKIIYLGQKNNNTMIRAIEDMYPSLGEDLSFKNYVNRFHALLFLEEIECYLNFRGYDKECAHFRQEGPFLSLAVENLAERRPSLVIGDSVHAINLSNNSSHVYEGMIHKVLSDRILLKFNSNFHLEYKGQDYRVEFHFTRVNYRKQHAAVARAIRTFGENFFFPTRIQEKKKPQINVQLNKQNELILCETNTQCRWYNSELNPIQKKCVVRALRAEVISMPYVIFGPPGTGKTSTLVEIILQLIKLLPSSRLLVGTPSNASADLITTRLIESKALEAGDFIRLVSQNLIEKELIPEHLAQHCATTDINIINAFKDTMIITESGLKLKCQAKYLGRHRVTIGTCSTLGNFMQLYFSLGHFTHVLIDESGQCTEPETMIVINLLSKNRGQVILAGDPQQLPAIVVNRYSRDRGLSKSFLERLLECTPYMRDICRFPNTCGYDPRIITKLLYNYRSLPSILKAYNDLFYESDLINVIDEKNSKEAEMLRQVNSILPESSTRLENHGAFFYGVLGENMQEEDSPSWYNPHESKMIFLMTVQLYRKGIKAENIGIITPYSKQVKHIRSLFVTGDIPLPKIGSVEEFQGQERDIILISVVRSSDRYTINDMRYSLGFTACPKRLNVAISRARSLLYVFGNPHLLSTDRYWRNYIKYCADNNAYFGCDLPNNIL